MLVDLVASVDDPFLLFKQRIRKVADSEHVELSRISIDVWIVRETGCLDLIRVMKNLGKSRSAPSGQSLFGVPKGSRK